MEKTRKIIMTLSDKSEVLAQCHRSATIEQANEMFIGCVATNYRKGARGAVTAVRFAD